ncbi:LegC family aminotransferase [Chitinophaga deserti]|uniref:LegC family aminotransferase n=1 Tax=Chitinophaga deserti TaxID=2164099 RepID=UPI000D6CFC5B|nr:LegC family aminotransferase [Chitinophaga deserti]
MELQKVESFIRSAFNNQEGFIPLHEPRFLGNEKRYLMETIDTTFVSSTGPFVNKFEEIMAAFTGARYAVAIVNGTAALHLALVLAGVEHGDEVITQPLTFVATANAITHAGGKPVFVDVDRDTMGMSPIALQNFLDANAEIRGDGHSYNKTTGKRIAACLPMHTFGFPLRINEIADICTKYNIPLVEDAAESLGSTVDGRHTGTIGLLGTFSFNGNKTVTCGGGGAIVTNDEVLGKKAKHISTTAKVPHAWEYMHDFVGYNYRMPNLNAALAVAQLEQLPSFLENKRQLAAMYSSFFRDSDILFVDEPSNSVANFWLNTLILPNANAKNEFLRHMNEKGIMCRPIWQLMNRLPMYAQCQTGDLTNAAWLEERVVNIPSSVRV